MKNSKLVKLLSSLDENELRHFNRFIHSDVFNIHKNVIRLFNVIRKKFRNKTFELDKMTAFDQLFPGENYNTKKIHDVMSYLLRTLERFLAFKEMYHQESTELIALSRSYRKRSFWKLFDSTVKRINSKQVSSPIQDMDFHYQNYQLEQEKYFALIGKRRTTETNLQTVTDLLDVSYFANRLRQSCYMIAHKNVYKAEYNFGIINSILEEVKDQKLYRIPAIGIYYHGFLALTDTDNIAHFKNLKQELVNNSQLFSKEEMWDIYVLATNIGIRYLNQERFIEERQELMDETYVLYKTGVEQGFLLTNGQISRFTYKNAVTLGLGLEEYEWTRLFIETNKDKLDKAYQEETYHYNLAKLNYATKQYDAALKLLMTTTLSDDVYVNLDTKILLAKVYYELDDFDGLEALISSFQTFIRRKQVISYQRLNYQNFINCLRKIVVVNKFDKQARKTLAAEIKALQPLPEKHWLLERLAK